MSTIRRTVLGVARAEGPSQTKKGHLLRLLLATAVLSFSAYADTITSVDVQLGTWNGSIFQSDGSIWNTTNANNWAVGMTAPGYSNPVEDNFQTVNLPDGQYWLYMAQYGPFVGSTAIQIALGYGSGTKTEVYNTLSSPETSAAWSLVSGSGFTASLISAPQTTYEKVGTGQTYTGAGVANWVVGINTATAMPEPSSISSLLTDLAAVGLLALAIGRKRLRRRTPPVQS